MADKNLGQQRYSANKGGIPENIKKVNTVFYHSNADALLIPAIRTVRARLLINIALLVSQTHVLRVFLYRSLKRRIFIKAKETETNLEEAFASLASENAVVLPARAIAADGANSFSETAVIGFLGRMARCWL